MKSTAPIDDASSRGEWKPPRRNARLIKIGRVTNHLEEWCRLSKISRNTLLGICKRHGQAVMVQTIKAGLAGKYDAALNKTKRRMQHLTLD